MANSDKYLKFKNLILSSFIYTSLYGIIILLLSVFLNRLGYSQNIYTGFRASRILNSYPDRKFPEISYWVYAGKTISSKFKNSLPSSIWIVSLYWGNGVTGLEFPSSGIKYPFIEFLNNDNSESYLTQFDKEGFKIWLQVEPGAASVDTLISLVMNRYKHHSCVIGFGIDVEWLNADTNPNGKKVTDAEAERWEKKVKSINSNYKFFLKHYSASYMPPTYRGDILFVDDSQEFSSISGMVNEFKLWGSKFYPNPVAFQFGYPIDKKWWGNYSDPMSQIGNSLLENIQNIYGLYWVDFTISQVFILSSIIKESKKDIQPEKITLSHNYPNPFNPGTNISFSLYSPGKVNLIIYDLLGKEIEVIINKYLNPGQYSIFWEPNALKSGVYICKLLVNGNYEVRKMTFLK